MGPTIPLPQTLCEVIAALAGHKLLILNLRSKFMNFLNKCLENDNTVVTYVVFIHHPIPCVLFRYKGQFSNFPYITYLNLSVMYHIVHTRMPLTFAVSFHCSYTFLHFHLLFGYSTHLCV